MIAASLDTFPAVRPLRCAPAARGPSRVESEPARRAGASARRAARFAIGLAALALLVDAALAWLHGTRLGFALLPTYVTVLALAAFWLREPRAAQALGRPASPSEVDPPASARPPRASVAERQRAAMVVELDVRARLLDAPAGVFFLFPPTPNRVALPTREAA
ncbi:MAG TPA: hypothetical protein VFS43_42440 [Polyangiaceae bacterium]|nr:hypothetical protein [Polyangiaceae bacterium]